MLPSYGEPTLTLVRGDGATVWDDAGNAYVDLVAGIAVNALGHAHPAVVEAVSRQVATLGHTSNLVANEPSLRLAERLLALTGRDGRVFFASSGAEANEAAFKMARRTGQKSKRAPFEPLPDGVSFVPYGDAAALMSAVGDWTAAVVLEPVLGEGGVVPAPAGYLETARQVTRASGVLLVLDEVQTGIGRTGSWFAHQAAGVEPDVLTLAKGLGGGLPVSACLAFGPAASLLQPGQHGTTFGGNPVSCAAALAVLDTIEADGLLERAETLGKTLTAGVTALGHPLIGTVRGSGLMLGIVLTEPVAVAVEVAARRHGFLVNAVAPDVIRLVPPLVLTDTQADSFLRALPAVLDAVSVPSTAIDGEDAL
jgi:acetylornithine aminotransferase